MGLFDKMDEPVSKRVAPSRDPGDASEFGLVNRIKSFFLTIWRFITRQYP